MGTESPNKVAAETPDLNAERLAELRRLFPEAFTEGKLDVEKLRAALGEGVESRAERYSFTWAGKRDAIRLLQMPSRATLVPCREESVAFDTTNHVFIEGDNLEVLKLLYKSYAGRVKMIYIDPPYNTGNDFVYRDHYADPLDAYLRLTGQKDENGNHTSSKTETNGRYHSAWLSMMFPRLFVARQLLAEDGILFVSIDDIEQPRLRMLLDEVFGEEQFIAAFIWKSRHNVDSRDKTGVSSDHEYVVCYGQRVQGKEKDLGKYTNPDNDPRGPWMSDNMLGLATKDKRPNLHYDLINPETNINYGCPEKGWRFDKRTMARKIEEKRIIWPASPDGRPRHKKFLNELESRFTGFSSLLDVPTTSAGTQALRAIFGTEVFEFPKPVELVKALVKQGNGEDAIYLDFFAGVCPLAQAILEQNRNDGVSRRFIVVQLPEPTPKDSVARNMGFQTVADIGKERIRRVIAKVQQERDESLPLNGNAEDLGFRVFKLAESNFRQWKAVEEHDFETWMRQMELFVDPLLPDTAVESAIFEIA
ncbi:site-specific DNA-methyltransferase, partial [Candidatus Poribacteria bacterium]|nr:site-specific DNA-methyltransferase [Candidatus Poribacteria bacterium]